MQRLLASPMTFFFVVAFLAAGLVFFGSCHN
jgi:hypothetical protein